MIDSIYSQQVESDIFSIYQYSDDIVSRWANQLENDIRKHDSVVPLMIDEFISGNKSVQLVIFSDSTNIINTNYNKTSRDSNKLDTANCNKIIRNNEILVKRLLQYLDGGYRKIQPVDIDMDNHSLFLFAIRKNDNKKIICGIIVNTLDFINENLSPKIQSVARDQFYFSVFHSATNKEVYTNDQYNESDKNIEHKKQLWLMPDYQLGIQTKGETIEDLVNKRTNFNIWTIVLMDLVLLLAAVLVYRSLRQQMKLAQLKSEFVSNVSHEIRTPMAIINMYSETLEMGRIKDEAKKMEYYKVINTEANRLSGIVNKILNFSKIESGKREYKYEETDINELIKDIINKYNHQFSKHGFNYILDLSENLPKVMLDREAITDAIINLIDNAIKYSLDKKQFDIKTKVNKGQICVEVRDYGIGIEEKYQKQVFDKFYRVTEGNLAHKAEGSGIGLSIVDHIMKAHRGSVSLISKLNKGSSFILNFPIN